MMDYKTLIDTYFAAGRTQLETAELLNEMSLNGHEEAALKYLHGIFSQDRNTHTDFNLTDAGNAEYFTHLYGDKLRYDHRRSRWLEWQEHHWREDTDSQVMRLALAATRRRYKEAVSIADLELREKVAKWTIGSEAKARLEATISIAKALKPIADNGERWDADPWLFCVKNGVIDLRTGILRDGQPCDLITKQAPVKYDTSAQAKLWQSFLDRITASDTELQGYLQRAVGYSLTGQTKQQSFFFAYGLGSNGKSTFLNTIRNIMGEYSHKLDVDDIMLKDKRAGSGGPKEGLADLQGKRFVLSGEIKDEKRLDVSLVKDMTGGETIRARRLYEHGVEYQPTHKLWLMGNKKPVITETTLAIWRRVKLIPFTFTIPDNEIDLEFTEKLEPEWNGILAWAVQGCLDWQRYGLKEPEAVTTATAGYRHDSDILGDFVEDVELEFVPMATISKSELKAEYSAWCEKNGVEPIKQTTFKSRMLEKGVTDGRSSDGQTRVWRGIRFKKDADKTDNSDKIEVQTRHELTILTGKSVKSPIEISHVETLQQNASEMSVLSEKNELPDCPACGANEWIMQPDGSLFCKSCGNISLSGGEQ